MSVCVCVCLSTLNVRVCVFVLMDNYEVKGIFIDLSLMKGVNL